MRVNDMVSARLGLSLRPACAGDVERVAALDALAFACPWDADAWTARIAAPDGFVVLALVPSDGDIVGYASFQTVLDEAELQRTAVALGHRRRGLARVLLTAAWPHLRSRGVRTCHLEVHHANAPAQALYRADGFRVVGRRRGYYQAPPGDALLMSRDL